MKTKQMVLCTALVLAAVAVTGCASKPASPEAQKKSARQAAVENAAPIRTEPAQRPAWVDTVPDSPTILTFIGSAGRYATATGNQGARYFAEENGRTQLVDYYGTFKK